MDTIVFSVASVVAVTAAMYFYIVSRIKYLKDNWVELRCNPLYMPFAGFVGVDVASNMMKCATKSFHDYAGFVVDPIMSEIDTAGDALGEIGGALKDMRSMLATVRGGFGMVFTMVFGKIENLMSAFQYMMIRIRTLMGRIVGTFTSLVYAFAAGEQTGEAVMNGPIGKTISFLCFHQDTTIQLKDGKYVFMNSLNLGDKLANGSTVTSVYIMNGLGVQMYELNGVRVTGSHKVLRKNKWIPVQNHPLARKCAGSNTLVCINTDKHRIRIGNTDFLDFVESTDYEFFRATNKYIESIYSKRVNPDNNIKYTQFLTDTGVMPLTPVKLSSGILTPILDIDIGDVLEGGNVVYGIVLHSIPLVNTLTSIGPNVVVGRGTWVLKDQQLYVAHNIGHETFNEPTRPEFLVQLITAKSTFTVYDKDGKSYTIVDELKTTEDYYHRFKDAMILNGSFRGKEIRV